SDSSIPDVARVLRDRLAVFHLYYYSQRDPDGRMISIALNPLELGLDPTFLRVSEAYWAYRRWLDVLGLICPLDARSDLFPPRVDRLFGADGDPSAPGYLEFVTYRLMLGCFLAATFQLDGAWDLLRILLLRGSLNHQLAITRFVELLTGSDEVV